ncbi:MAG: MlaC/ttg2D family ABC transporter substrate-binding protein [Gammaproteobacteria bacterium]
MNIAAKRQRLGSLSFVAAAMAAQQFIVYALACNGASRHVGAMFCMKHPLTTGLLLVSLLNGASMALAASEDPRATVESMLRDYSDLAILWADLEDKERRDRMAPIINTYVADEAMYRYALGGRARALTRSQRSRLDAGFERFIRLRLGKTFYVGVGAKAEILAVRDAADRNKRVSTRMSVGDGASVEVDYILARRANRWLVVNVFREGVSELALWRTEFARILDDRGPDALARRLSGNAVNKQVGGNAANKQSD